MRSAMVPFFVWLYMSLATLLPGLLIVHYLPRWSSIPLMVGLALMATFFGTLWVAMCVPGNSSTTRWRSTYYSIMLTLALASPTMIAIKLYDWVG